MLLVCGRGGGVEPTGTAFDRPSSEGGDVRPPSPGGITPFGVAVVAT